MTGSIRFQVGATLAALLVVAVLVFQTSSAAFSGTTANSGNSFSAATVSLSDDDSDAVLFNLSNMKPGDADAENCIEVTYTGSVAADVKLYGAIGAGDGLGQYLDLTVMANDAGAFGDCAAFDENTAATLYTGTLAAFATSHANWANGLDAGFDPTAANDAKVYKFVVGIQDDNDAQGLTASTVSFTWEAQNT